MQAISLSEPSPFTRPFEELEPDMRFDGRGRTITEADVVQFAGTTGDMHPQHMDEQWAATSRFGGRIAHGMLVLSCAIGLLAIVPDRVIALRRIRNATFKRPVRLGDTIRPEGRISKLSPLDDRSGLVTASLTVLNQHDRCVARAELELVWASTCSPDDEPGMALL